MLGETEKFFFSLDSGMVRETGYSQCEEDFETLYNYLVTEQMDRTFTGELSTYFTITAPFKAAAKLSLS